MPVLTLYRHGGKGGVPPCKNSHDRVRRGKVQGWSPSAARRNTEFLMSIREPELSGSGFAVTLTLRDCPPTPELWQRMRVAWVKRMQRDGMIRLHWVTEWQRRGVPHLHGAVWLPSGCPLAVAKFYVIQHWLAVAQEYGAGPQGQFVHEIDGPVGWFQYLSKHAARGVSHYQRSADKIPTEWASGTGRIWGHSGEWPLQEKIRVELQDNRAGGDGGWFAYRRLCRSWRKADARAKGCVRRLRSARSMLTCHDQDRSRVIGVMEWITYEVQTLFLANLAVRGFTITS